MGIRTNIVRSVVRKAGLFMYDYGIENGYVYIGGAEKEAFQKINLYIIGEKIATLSTEKHPCKNCVDATGKYVLPGFIDPHVHFALGVGKNISKDDFYTGSMEAALGGVTTYIDFLDPIKETKELAGAFKKRSELAKDSLVDYAFHTTIANPISAAEEIFEESLKYGINSIKLFTTYAETDRRTFDNDIEELLKASVKVGGKVVIHAENDELIDHRKDILVKDHEKSRPVITENIEVVKLAQMARETGGNLYIVHVSAGSSVALLKQNFAGELASHQITLESCPHYFLLNADALSLADGYKYTMTPPIRPEKDRQLLVENVDAISTIGTDHCPYTKEQKCHTYTSEIPMGIGGIRYSFLNMYQEFGFSILDRFTSEPADAYGLKQKGSLIPGKDADIVIFDTEKKTRVSDEMSVYDKKELKGAIETVFSRGSICCKEGVCKAHHGRYVERHGCYQ